MYTNIYNPETKQNYNISSIEGKATLRNFMIMIGGAKDPCNRLRKTKDPKCKDHPECEWITKKGCKNKQAPVETQKNVKKKTELVIDRDDVGRQVLHDGAAMLLIKNFRHKQKFKITDEILDKFINSETYHTIIAEYLRELMDDEIILGSRPNFAKPPYIKPSICSA